MSATRANLRDRIRELADQVGGTFCTDDEINARIAWAANELWRRLSSADDSFALTSHAFTLAGNTYDLATNLPTMKTARTLDLDVGGRVLPLRMFEWAERHRFLSTSGADGNYILWYVPKFGGYSTDGTTEARFDEWEEFIVTEGAIRCLSKEESNIADLRVRKQEIIDQIDWSAKRGPHRIPDHYEQRNDWVHDGRRWCIAGGTLYVYW